MSAREELERLRAVPIVQRPEIARAVRAAYWMMAPAPVQVAELERTYELADTRPERTKQ